MVSAGSPRRVLARPCVARSLFACVLASTVLVLLASLVSVYTELTPLLSDDAVSRDVAAAGACVSPQDGVALYMPGERRAIGDPRPPHHDSDRRRPPHHHDDDDDNDSDRRRPPHHHDDDDDNDSDRRRPPHHHDDDDDDLSASRTSPSGAYTSAHMYITASIVVALSRTLMGALLVKGVASGSAFNVLLVLTSVLVVVHALLLVSAFDPDACGVAASDMHVALALFACSTVQWLATVCSLWLPEYLEDLEHNDDGDNADDADDADALLSKTVSVHFDDEVDAPAKP